MKSRPDILVLMAFLALMLTANIQAQTTNPPYLSQMPSTARVRPEIKGADALDTAARQMGAFKQLMEIINTLAGPRYQNNEFTPDEDRVKSQYFDAWQRFQYKENAPPPQDQPRWAKLRAFYENDPGFLDDLLKRFFSPEFRAGYYRATGKQPPQLVASQPSTRPNTQPSTSAANSAEAYADEGYKFLQAKDYAKAIEAYKKALAINRSSRRGYQGLALVYEEQKQWQPAIENRQKLMALKPDDADTLLTLASDYVFQKEYQRGISASKQYIALRPGDAKGLFMLGVAHRAAEEFPQAVEAFRGAIRLNPEKQILIITYNHLGYTYLQIGKKEDALQVYRALKPLDPALAQKLYDAINQPTAATPQPKTSVTSAEAFVTEGNKYSEAKDYVKAVEAYKKAVSLQPFAGADNAELHLRMAIAYFKLFQFKNAETAAQQAIRLKPDYQVAYNWLGSIDQVQEKYSEAIIAYQQAVRLDPNDKESLNLLGRTFVKLGRQKDALQVYRKLLLLDKKMAQELYAEINTLK